MTTWIVAAAAKRLYEEKQEMTQQAFIQYGITIHPDGSQDEQIKLKDILSTDIDFRGWETAYETYVKQESFSEIDPAFDEMTEFTTVSDDFGLPRVAPTRYKQETVETLKRMLEQRSLKKTGRKADLIHQLETADAGAGDLAHQDTTNLQDIDDLGVSAALETLQEVECTIDSFMSLRPSK